MSIPTATTSVLRFKAGTVEITTSKGKQSIAGYLAGPFGVHKSLNNGKGWTITHLPTGLEIAHADTKAVACQVAAEVFPTCDWYAVTQKNCGQIIPKATVRYLRLHWTYADLAECAAAPWNNS